MPTSLGLIAERELVGGVVLVGSWNFGFVCLGHGAQMSRADLQAGGLVSCMRVVTCLLFKAV